MDASVESRGGYLMDQSFGHDTPPAISAHIVTD